MNLPSRDTLFGLTLGALFLAGLAGYGPNQVIDSFADEMPAGFDTDGLVKIDGSYYDMDHEDWVATDPISTATVKKVEAGQVTYVNIATTATGTYSTDGLTSRHVKYPGIEVEKVYPSDQFWFSRWYDGQWVRISSYNGNSYVTMQNNGVRVSTSKHGTCVSSHSFSIC